MRDVETLILQTLRVKIAEGTDVPSGSIWAHRPASEFLQVQKNGPNTGPTTPAQLPAVSINYQKDAKFGYNNYGDFRYVNDDEELSTVYAPLGELRLFLAISLFAESKKELRELTTQLYMTLLKSKFMTLVNDPVPGEYAGIELTSQRDTSWTTPFHKVFIVEAHGRVLGETQAYTIKEAEINVETLAAGYATPVSGMTVRVQSNPLNPLNLDTMEEHSEGTFKNTVARETDNNPGVTWHD